MKFGRNLTASEILDQALHFRRKEAVNHAVFMGMGEPLMNLDNVLAACERLPGHRHRALEHRCVDRGLDPRHRPDDATRGRRCGWRCRSTRPTRRCARS